MNPASANPPKIALHMGLAHDGSRAEVRGILDYAREHGPWHVLLQEGRLDEQLLDLSRLGVDGVIAESPSPKNAPAIATLGVPVVLLEDPEPDGKRKTERPLAGAPRVRMDSRAVGSMAAEYYIGRGYTSFAYVDETLGYFWSVERSEAAARLDALLHGRAPKPRNIAVPPLGVRTRGSTGYDAMRDPFLARAIAYIRSHSNSRIEVADVVAAARCSRRYLETRFRSRLGTTIFGMAQRERIGRVKELLENTTMPIGEIAERCGFPGNSDLSILFRRIAGTSLRDWRAGHRETPGGSVTGTSLRCG